MSKGAFDQKPVDPESELNNVIRLFKRLAPLCSVAKRAQGLPQLAPQKKQLGILTKEMNETNLIIRMATKGRHALHDASVRRGMTHALVELEHLKSQLRDGEAQLGELNCLNYLSSKKRTMLVAQIPSESDELAYVENAINRLKQLENRLEMATRRFCIVNTDNAKIREEIHRLLVERDSFNIQWTRIIERLVAGKIYLMDILEIANNVFGDRDEACRKLEALKWQGHYGLNKDIAEMQQCESDLNHLVKLEAFLRVKGSTRICEADEKARIKFEEEVARCEMEISKHDQLLNEIFTYTERESLVEIMNNFRNVEIENFAVFQLLCDMLQESILGNLELNRINGLIDQQHDFNEKRKEREEQRIADLRDELVANQQATLELTNRNIAAESMINVGLKGVEELVMLAKCNISHLQPLLGPHRYVTQWNVNKFLKILEKDVKDLVQIAYSNVGSVDTGKGAVPPPTKGHPQPGKKMQAGGKLVADPYYQTLYPNKIENIVSYRPCAYCVEDYIMNQVMETPAVLATNEFIHEMFHQEEPNTPFGIYTITVPAKRHPYKSTKD